MVTAKILEVDTSKTTLKVKLIKENGDTLDCWVTDSLTYKLLNNIEYINEFHNYSVFTSDSHNWIQRVERL